MQVVPVGAPEAEASQSGFAWQVTRQGSRIGDSQQMLHELVPQNTLRHSQNT